MKFYYKTDIFDGAVISMVNIREETRGLTGLPEKKEFLYNLLNKECPLGDDFTNSNCPIRNVRKMKAEKRELYVNSLSEEQIDFIHNYHKNCCGFFSFYLTTRNDRVVGVSYQ
jgi:hypothetical protein